MTRQPYSTTAPDDLIDYPVSESFWRDAYHRGLTPHRPPDPYPRRIDDQDMENLRTEVQELRDLVQAQDRTINQLVESSRSKTIARPPQQPPTPSQRTIQPGPSRRGRRIEIGEVEV